MKRELNLKSREDYIEPDYVDGIRDSKGNLVIRALNENEKEFLNKFYAETIVTDFLYHPELKRLNNKKKMLVTDDSVSKLKAEVLELREEGAEKNKTRINELKRIIRLTKQQNAEIHFDEICEIDIEMQEIREEYLLYSDKEDHKQFYGANNARNNCLYNKIKSMSQLINYEPDYDDVFCSLSNSLFSSIHTDNEGKLISELEREAYEEEEERLKSVIKEEKLKK